MCKPCSMAFSVGGMKSHSLLCQGKWRTRKRYRSGIKEYRGRRRLHACGGLKTMSCFITVPSLNIIPFDLNGGVHFVILKGITAMCEIRVSTQ
mgnify:CR=1 FL=1